MDKKPRKKEYFLSDAERERLERHRLTKQQFQTFSELYPQQIERNSVKYPIPDQLLAEYPQLHGYKEIKKPESIDIALTAEEFEQVLYIWEFCNNFSEYINTPPFQIEELRAALSYTFEDDPRMDMSQEEIDELTWNEKMELRHIREKGIHMFNCLHTAMAECFLQDMFPQEGLNGTP